MLIGPETSSSPRRTRGWIDLDRLVAYARPSWTGTITAWVAAIVVDLMVLYGASLEHRRACPGARSAEAGFVVFSLLLLVPVTGYGIWRAFVHLRRTRNRFAVPVMVVLGVAFVATVVGEYFVLRGLPAHLRPYCVIGD